MSFYDNKAVLRFVSIDEEEGEISECVVALEDVSHIYWDADADGIIVPRRAAAEDYSYDNVSFFFDNTPDMVLCQQGFVQVHEKMFVPARNIVTIRQTKGGSEMEIGDLHPVFTRRDTLGLLQEWRRELLRGPDARGAETMQIVEKAERLIAQHSVAAHFPEP